MLAIEPQHILKRKHCERGHRVEAVEKKMRIELAAQRAQLRFARQHAQLERAMLGLHGAIEGREHVVPEHCDE